MKFSESIHDFKVISPGRLLAKEVRKSLYYLPPACAGGICIDAGCNIGDFELKHKGRFDKYVCIDVLQQNLDLLEKNLVDTDLSYDILKRACFDVDGKLMNVYAHRLYDGTLNYFGNNASVGVKLYEDLDSNWGWHEEDVLDRVESISIDRLVDMYGEIKCLKVDIEGAEYDFLIGKDLSNIEYITGEFHFDYKNPNGELMLYLRKTHKIIKRRGYLTTLERI